MKIYTAEFEAALRAPRKFHVPPHSEFAIGVKATVNGVQAQSVSLSVEGGAALEPEDDKIDGFTVFKTQSGAPGAVAYVVAAQGVAEPFRLTQVASGSTVFEVNAGGGSGPVGDYATKEWVNGKLEDYALEDSLSDYAEASSLTAYAQKSDLDGYAQTSALTAYATKEELSPVSLSAQQALSASGEAVVKKASGLAPEVSCVTSIYESDWAALSANPDPHALYVVLADPS